LWRNWKEVWKFRITLPYMWRVRSEAIPAEKDLSVMWRNRSEARRVSIAMPHL